MLVVLGLTAAAPQCSNPYINNFKKYVTIYQSPVKVGAFCGGEWSRFGTCCEVNSLKQRVEKDKQSILQAVQRVVESIHTTSKEYNQLFQKSQKFLHKRKSGSVLLVEAFSDSHLNRFKSDLKEFVSSQTLQSDFDNCWLHMIQIRSSTLCGACSGRNNIFFSRDGKGLISQETCSSILQHCHASFSILVRFIEGLDSFQQTIILSFGDNRKNLVLEMKRLDEVTDSIRENKIQMIIEQMLKSQSHDERNELAKIICERMVNLERATFIQQVDDLLHYNTHMFDVFHKILDNKMPARRVLTSPNLGNFAKALDLFKGDVIVFSMKDTSANNVLGHSSAFAFDMQFP